MNKHCSVTGIAIDCGGTKTAVARVVSGNIVKQLQVDTPTNASPEQLVDVFSNMVQQLHPQSTDKIGAALTGRVDQYGMWHAVNQKTLGNISKVPIANMLEQRFKRKVCVINDATAGAIAEHRFGAGNGCTRMAYVTVSTGVGSGIVIDDKPLFSPNGLVGQVGFASSTRSTRLCGSGRQGTVESIAAGNAIAKLAERAGYAVEPADVFTAFRQGEGWAVEIISNSANAIAELSADLTAILDLELIVLGGSIGLAEGYLMQVKLSQLELPELFRVPILKASLNNSVLIGALAH